MISGKDSNSQEELNRTLSDINKQLKNNTWDYKKLLILLESWSENTEYSDLIYQTIVDRKLP